MSEPQSATVRSLSELVTKGTTPTTLGRAYTSHGVRFLKVETFTADGTYIPGREAFIDDTTNQLLRRSQLVEDDILFSIAGALGRSTIVERAWLPANTNQALAIIRPRKRGKGAVDPRYLLWTLRSPQIERLIAEINVQAAQANLSLEQVRAFEIPVISLEEQRTVVDALEDVGRLIASLERVITKKRAIKQGMMQELLTGRTRLHGFSGEWRSSKFAELLSYQQPGRFLVSGTDYVDSGTPVLTAGKTFVLGYTTETTGIYDSLPAIIFDDFTTDTKYVDFPFKAKSSAMKILSAKPGVDLRFAFERMQLVDFVAVDHKRRWIAEYSKIEVDVPSIDVQRAIARIADDANAEIEALERRLEATRAIKQGMMQELLTGRTRLVPMEASA